MTTEFTTVQYEHQCSQCDKSYMQRQSWIDPEKYTNPETATITASFWCPKCHKGQALRFKMLPDMKIEIHGHTDNTGSAELNVKLSQQRAETVKNYLIQKGIAVDRVGSKGFGGAKPIADNSHEATRKLNRRVEFVIVE